MIGEGADAEQTGMGLEPQLGPFKSEDAAKVDGGLKRAVDLLDAKAFEVLVGRDFKKIEAAKGGRRSRG
ncbi:MAG: hypothetical protein NTV52_35335 [Acidobacteria bacterium]|nr:hypothetical protein [Acidobacteriota bacterium]